MNTKHLETKFQILPEKVKTIFIKITLMKTILISMLKNNVSSVSVMENNDLVTDPTDATHLINITQALQKTF